MSKPCIIKYKGKSIPEGDFKYQLVSGKLKELSKDLDRENSLLNSEEVQYNLKSFNKLVDNFDKVNKWIKLIKDKNQLFNKIQKDLQIPLDQIDIIKSIYTGQSLDNLLVDLYSNYSYTIEINTTKEQIKTGTKEVEGSPIRYYSKSEDRYYRYTEELGWISFDENNKNQEVDVQTPKDLEPVEFDTYNIDTFSELETQHYSNLSAPGGTKGKSKYEGNPDWEYHELEFKTPLITPSIKGHAQFSTDNGIGWVRVWYNKKTGAVEIQEVQSDLFQKGRDKEDLVGINKVTKATGRGGDFNDKVEFIEGDKKQNQFLQLLNKDNNWVTFFVKSIIQDSVKKGYEKVLFPTGNTASKVEGHTTLEEFKKEKEDRLKQLEDFEIIERKNEFYLYYANNNSPVGKFSSTEEAEKFKNLEINQLKQELERVENEGFAALKPIYNFYENTVANILKKQGYNPVIITDEYGNTWNEINIKEIESKIQEIDLLPTTKSREQISLETLDLSTIPLFSDSITSKQQEETINYLTGEVVSYITSTTGNTDTLINEKLNEIKENFQSEDNLDENLQLILDVWDSFTEAVKFNIKSFNIDFDSHEENAIEDEKEGNFEDNRTLKENPYLKIGQEIKKQLFTIIDVESINGDEVTMKTNWFGFPTYKSINETLPVILSYTKDLPANYNIVRGELEKNIEAQNWFLSLIYSLDNASEQTRIQFTRWTNKHVVNLKYLHYNNRENNFRYNNSNSGRQQDVVIESWVENLKMGNLFTLKDNLYTINKEESDKVLEKYKQLKDNFSVNKEVDFNALSELLNSIGVEISVEDLMSMQKVLDTNGFEYNKARVNFNQYFLSDNGALHYMMKKLTDKSGVDSFDKNNPLTDNSGVKSLALLYSMFNPTPINDSYKNANNDTVYAYSQNKFSIDQFKKLEDKEFVKDLMKTQFSRNSTWGKVLTSDDNYERNLFLDNFALDYADAAKDANGRVNRPFDELTEVEQETFRFFLFQNQGRLSTLKGKRVGSTSYLTMSDKSTLLTVQHLLEDFTYDFENNTITDATALKLSEIVLAEYNRIIAFENLKDKSQLPKQYLEGADKFIISNYITRSEIEDGEGLLDTEKLKNKVKEHFNNQIQNKLQTWRDTNIIDPTKKDIEGFKVDKQYLDYIKTKVTQSDNFEHLTIYAAMDYELNNQLANFNIIQLFVGDPATHWNKTLEATLVNIGKRLAGQIAPGNNLANTRTKDIAGINGHQYIQLFVSDQNIVSSNIKYITRVLDKKEISDKELNILENGNKSDKELIYNKYPKASAYMNIESTDAQEYTTGLEFVYHLFHEGKLSDEKYLDLVDKLVKGDDLTKSDIDLIFNPIKPVYYGGEVKTIDNLSFYDLTYIKSSAFPLLKELTAGTELDKIRIQMEEVQNPNNSKNPEDFTLTRMAFKTATKIGYPQELPIILNSDNTVNEIDFTNNKKILNRDNYRIQQEVPFKEKTKVNRGTQEIKLLFGDLLNIDFDGKSGYQLRQEFLDYNDKLFKSQLDVIKKRLDVHDGKFDFEKLRDILIDEAKTRKYSLNDIESLRTINESEFVIPLMFNNSANKFESLLISLIDNNVRKQKQTGYSSPLGSNAGFKYQSDLTGVNESEIITIEGWDGELKHQRIEDGVVKGSQILLPFKFADNKGNLLNQKDFIIEKNGRKYIDHSKLPKELLKSFGYRIPTQGLNSMSYIEIVGFLPESAGDLLIAPSEFTKQMGSDFDIDKLYGYLYNTYYDSESGKLKKFKFNESNFRERYSKALEGDEKLDNLMLSIFDETVEITDLENKINLSNIKDLQNKILDIHFKVLSNPNEEVQSKILESLGFGELGNLKTKYDNKSVKNLDILSSDYQVDKYIKARSGKAGTGYFSTLITFNSIIQGHNLKFIKDDVENHLVITKKGTGLSNNLDNEGILKSENIKAYQSAAVDDEKEQILGSLNINNITFYSIGAWLLDGHSQEDIIAVIKQPIIEEYVKLLGKYKNTFDGITPNADSLVYNYLKDKYQSNGSIETSELSELENRTYSYKELFDATFALDSLKDKEWNLLQLSILDKFITADAYGKQIQKTINAFGVDSKGLGKSFLQAELMALSVEDELSPEKGKIENINNLKQSIGYLSYQNALQPTIQLFSNQFNYLNRYNKNVLEKYQKYTLNESLTTTEIETVFRDIHNNMKASIYSNMVKQFNDKNLNGLRKELMYGENSLAKRILEIKKENNNSFLLMLQAKISPDSTLPDSVTMRSVGGELFDDASIYSGFLDLFRNTETQQLAVDLINYFYLNGGLQQAREYSRYIPTGYLAASGYAEYLRNININNFSNVLGTSDKFLQDYFRNQPYKTPKIPEGVSIKDNSFQLDNENGIFYLEGTEKYYVPYLHTISKIDNITKYRLFQHIDSGKYNEIPTLGTLYNYEYGTELSVYPENNIEVILEPQESRKQLDSDPVIENTEYVSQDIKSLGLKTNTNTKQLIESLKSLNSDTANAIAAVIEHENIPLTLQLSNENSFSPSTNIIKLDKAETSLTKLKVALVHEATHGITSKILNKILVDPNNPNFDGLSESQKLSFVRLNNIYKNFLDKITKGEFKDINISELNAYKSKIEALKNGENVDFNQQEIDKYNKFINLKEFIAEAFSNKSFQTELNNIEYKAKKSFLQELVESIANFINKFKGVNPNSVLAQVLYDGFNLASEIKIQSRTFKNEEYHQAFIKGGLNAVIELIEKNKQKELSASKQLSKEVNLLLEFESLNKKINKNNEETDRIIELYVLLKNSTELDFNYSLKELNITSDNNFNENPVDIKDLLVTSQNDLGMSIQEYLSLLPKENRVIFRKLINEGEIKTKCK